MKDKILNTLVRWKILFDRAKNYIGYFQFFVMIYMALKISDNSPVRQFMFRWWYITFPAILIACLMLGYVEKMLKIREREQENYSKANPQWNKLTEKVDGLTTKIDKLSESQTSAFPFFGEQMKDLYKNR